MALATGQSRLLSAVFTKDGVRTNGTVTLTIKSPSDETSTPTPTNVSPGVYEYALLLEEAGDYVYKWASTGDVVAASNDRTITVVASTFDS